MCVKAREGLKVGLLTSIEFPTENQRLFKVAALRVGGLPDHELRIVLEKEQYALDIHLEI